MPVIDHPIHPSTQKGKDFRYGCWNGDREFLGYVAPDRELNLLTGKYELNAVWIKHELSKECRYDLSNKDNNCKGCKHVPQSKAFGNGEEVAMSELRQSRRKQIKQS